MLCFRSTLCHSGRTASPSTCSLLRSC